MAAAMRSYRERLQHTSVTGILCIQAHDIRGFEQDFTLDKQGFELRPQQPLDCDLTNEQTIKEIVYPQSTNTLCSTGASKVRVFAHSLRRVTTKAVDDQISRDKIPSDQPVKGVPPARYAHVDQSESGALATLANVLEADEMASWTKTRWAIVNLWKPLKPVHRDPLAICDARTVADSDLAGMMAKPRQPNNSSTGNERSFSKMGKSSFEINILRANPQHQWYFASRMTPEECLLIKIYDSSGKDGRARRAPHSAITVPGDANDDASPRESIEVRTCLCWENEAAE